ncbi:MAG: hypothetical protein H6651_08255 [Ardenticatenales bacterium]|nr:hypothetical protein [Ardenticatenales bacterium]
MAALLEYESLPGETRFYPPAAPILELTEDLLATANRLANETEALFARIETELQVNLQRSCARVWPWPSGTGLPGHPGSLLPEAMASLHPSEFSAMLDGNNIGTRKPTAGRMSR